MAHTGAARLRTPAGITPDRSRSATTPRPRESTPRTRATAFDAARSGSWHYYSPQPSSRPSARPVLGALAVAAVSESVTTSIVEPRPIFDAANPSTWARVDRVLPVSLLESEQRTAPPSRSTTTSIATPESLQEWSTYLAASNMSSIERADILSDVFLTLQRTSSLPNQSASTVQPSTPAEVRPRAFRSSSSILDDPDFGDTSAYWNSLSGESIPTRSRLASMRERLLPERTTRAPQRARVDTIPVRPSLPRQPTHLNYDRITPQLTTVRRRPSTASIASHASNGTLPEYSASASHGQYSLPAYHQRASLELSI